LIPDNCVSRIAHEYSYEDRHRDCTHSCTHARHRCISTRNEQLTGEDIGVQKFIAELAVRVILFAQVNEVGQPLIYGFQFGR